MHPKLSIRTLRESLVSFKLWHDVTLTSTGTATSEQNDKKEEDRRNAGDSVYREKGSTGQKNVKA